MIIKSNLDKTKFFSEKIREKLINCCKLWGVMAEWIRTLDSSSSVSNHSAESGFESQS